jgi:hypothetical protein
MRPQVDGLQLVTFATVRKFRASDIEDVRREGLAVATLADFESVGIDPYETIEAARNLMVNGGIGVMLDRLIGLTPTSYINGNARICVGDGNGSVPTAAATDTALAAPTNRYAQTADATYPSRATQVVTIVATFPTTQGNFVWNEWGIDSGGVSGSGAASGLLNHRGVNLGTKTSASTWAFTATITEA